MGLPQGGSGAAPAIRAAATLLLHEIAPRIEAAGATGPGSPTVGAQDSPLICQWKAGGRVPSCMRVYAHSVATGQRTGRRSATPAREEATQAVRARRQTSRHTRGLGISLRGRVPRNVTYLFSYLCSNPSSPVLSAIAEPSGRIRPQGRDHGHCGPQQMGCG